MSIASVVYIQFRLIVARPRRPTTSVSLQLFGLSRSSSRVCLVHVYGPNQAHGVQQPRVWLPASTLEPGSRAATPPPRRHLHPELRPNPPFLQSQARALQAQAMAPKIFSCARAGGRRGGGRRKARVTAPSSRHSSLL
jgi:hypothetical protein